MVSHPIQYQAPLLRRIASEPGIRLRVLFERIDPANTYFDEGFQRTLSWDVPLTEGYDHAALADVDIGREIAEADAIWLHGWQTKTLRGILAEAHRHGRVTLMRGENCDLAMPDGAGPRGWLKRLYIARIFSKCSGFLTIGGLNAAYYAARGIDETCLFRMPYAVDNVAFSARAHAAQAESAVLRRALGIADGTQVVLFAGKLMARKRCDLLIDAMGRLGTDRPVKLVVVGDGEDRARLESAARDTAFVGFVNQSELPAYYALADAFVLPSEREPWGLAVNEAMACGTAVVVSDQVGCAPDLVTDDVGRVFKSGDAGALARALTDTLAHADAMGAHARTRIAHWDYEADVDGLKQALGAFGVLS